MEHFELDARKEENGLRLKVRHADAFLKSCLYTEKKIMLFSIFDDTSNSMKNHQMNLYAVTFLLPKSRKQNITE